MGFMWCYIYIISQTIVDGKKKKLGVFYLKVSFCSMTIEKGGGGFFFKVFGKGLNRSKR